MTHKTKIILLVSILFLILSVAAFTIITLKVEKAGIVLEERVQIIADQFAKEQKFTELTELVTRTQTQRESLEQYILSEPDTISFLTEIEHIGSEQGVELVTNSLNVTDQENGSSLLTVSFSISGAETQVYRMLTILESLPYESQVQRVDYAVSEVAVMNIILSLTII